MDSFDAYIRVSKVGDRSGASSFISPDVQRETVKRLAAVHKLTIGELIQELDISGSTPIDERELGRLVRKVEKGASGGLLVWKLSRFSRSLLDGVTVADRIQRAGGRLIAEDFDSAAPMGKAMLGLLLGGPRRSSTPAVPAGGQRSAARPNEGCSPRERPSATCGSRRRARRRDA